MLAALRHGITLYRFGVQFDPTWRTAETNWVCFRQRTPSFDAKHGGNQVLDNHCQQIAANFVCTREVAISRWQKPDMVVPGKVSCNSLTDYPELTLAQKVIAKCRHEHPTSRKASCAFAGLAFATSQACLLLTDSILNLFKNAITMHAFPHVLLFAASSVALRTRQVPAQHAVCRFSPSFSQDEVYHNSASFEASVFYWDGQFHQDGVGYHQQNGLTIDHIALGYATGLPEPGTALGGLIVLESNPRNEVLPKNFCITVDNTDLNRLITLCS